MQKPKKKPALTPEAAKILEQYRNAGKKTGDNTGIPDGSDSEDGSGRTTAPPPSAAIRPRSGTRGK
jgi:hypothetical protein